MLGRYEIFGPFIGFNAQKTLTIAQHTELLVKTNKLNICAFTIPKKKQTHIEVNKPVIQF
jgi:hypothetical protein